MKRLVLLLLNLLMPMILFAASNDLCFRHFSVEDGLSSNSVRALMQDKYGFLWIGTDEGLNRYDGDHFGKVLWVKNYIGNLDPDKDYYRNNATKNDGNLYLKANYELCSGVNAYADLQYRHISYKMYGQNDKWNSVTNDGLQQLAIHEKFDFFNPKAGYHGKLTATTGYTVRSA